MKKSSWDVMYHLSSGDFKNQLIIFCPIMLIDYLPFGIFSKQYFYSFIIDKNLYDHAHGSIFTVTLKLTRYKYHNIIDICKCRLMYHICTLSLLFKI